MSDTPMIRCGSVERTHPQLQERAARIASGLAGLGVTAGDNIAVVLANSVEFLEISAGISLSGANPVPVNWHWKSAELAHLLTDSAAKAAFVHSDFAAVVDDATVGSIPLIVVSSTGESVPGSHREYESWLAGHEPEGSAAPAASGLGLIYTSGTTGKPKGIVREAVSAESMVRMAMGAMARMGLRPGGRTLIPAPLYHTAPNTMGVFAVRLGMDTTILTRFDPEEFLAAIERHRVEQVQMVPTMFTRLLRLPEQVRRKYDLSSLTSIVHSAAPCPQHVKQQMIDWLGPIVTEYYGGSETGPIVWCSAEEWLRHLGTVGAPVDGAAVRIVGPDNREAPVGEVGVVYLKPADYWPGFTYRGDDTKRRDIELDGFVTVGDMGRVDAEGYLYLTDRMSDMVISGGVNIYPAEIEGVLHELPEVADCAVFGIPDEEYGESLAAHIELAEGAELTEAEVRDFVRARLAGFKVPRVVVFDDELPREESGKLFKRRLRDPYWRDAATKI
ncbi:AMP-binding protein [Nocardia sp. NPDC052001]|uniref:AMP-binding protein n=1 Tax=Nocardia sp. NPDC052001 TaxID=3154853 RepID=UPI0034337748